MRSPIDRARAAAPSLAALALASLTLACSRAREPAAAAADARAYASASADSCLRALRRAEAAPEFRVAREARALRTNEMPRFPLGEPKRRYQQVTARYMIDTAGRVDTSTVEILTTSGEAFSRQVLLTLPTWRFEPAELVPGCRVPFRMTNNIVFNAPGA